MGSKLVYYTLVGFLYLWSPVLVVIGLVIYMVDWLRGDMLFWEVIKATNED